MSTNENASEKVNNQTEAEPTFKIGDKVWAVVGTLNNGSVAIVQIEIAGVVYSRKDKKTVFEGYKLSDTKSSGFARNDRIFATKAEAEIYTDDNLSEFVVSEKPVEKISQAIKGVLEDK